MSSERYKKADVTGGEQKNSMGKVCYFLFYIHTSALHTSTYVHLHRKIWSCRRKGTSAVMKMGCTALMNFQVE